jgi:predicted phage terminase large subunit-like protein
MHGNLEQARLLLEHVARAKAFYEKADCEDRLINYVKYAWPVIDPYEPFRSGYAIDAIADHLEAVTYGHIIRLLVNVPPGFTKSTMVDVMWPTWEWGPRNMPGLRYLCASYQQGLTIRDNMRCLNLIRSDRYQRYWGDRFKLTRDAVIQFINDKTGWKLAASVTGAITGYRGDRFIIDDPNNPNEVESETVREATKMWFTEIVGDRLNNLDRSAIVIIQQRVHGEDISGIALAKEMGYTHLCIPMEYLPRVYVNGFDPDFVPPEDDPDAPIPIKSYFDTDVTAQVLEYQFWRDHRSRFEWYGEAGEGGILVDRGIEGELAWPERFKPMTVARMKREKTDYAWAGQYQQTPSPRGGGILKEAYWRLWDDGLPLPAFFYLLASVDTAQTEDERNDPSACTIWGLFYDKLKNVRIMLLYSWAARLEFHELVERLLYTCTMKPVPPALRLKDEDGYPILRFPVHKLLIENKSNGKDVNNEITRSVDTHGAFGIELIEPVGDKTARAHSVAHVFHQGIVNYLDREYCQKVIDECSQFPSAAHDDLFDTTTQAVRYFRDNFFVFKAEERKVEEDAERQYRRQIMSAAQQYES